MKKDYLKPHMKVIIIEGCDNILHTSSSFLDIDGTTDKFSSPRRDYRELWEDSEEDDE